MQISDNQLGFSASALPAIISPIASKARNGQNHFAKRYNSTYRAPTEMPSMLSPKGMGVSGGRAAIHERKASLTALKSFQNNIPMQDMIDYSLNKPQFGMGFYKSPSNEMLMKRIPNGKADRSKNPDFQERTQKKVGWIPAPNKYNLTIDWTKELSKNNGKFLKQERVTFSDAQIRMTKKANGPSPQSYNPDQWKKKTSIKKAIGTYTVKDSIITFVTEASNIANNVPAANKYDTIDLDRFKEEREKFTKIHQTNYPRFKPTKKDLSPAPTSYNYINSVQKSSTLHNSAKYSIFKDKKSFVQDERVKEIYSTSPAHYKLEKVLDKVARTSPVNRSKRQ